MLLLWLAVSSSIIAGTPLISKCDSANCVKVFGGECWCHVLLGTAGYIRCAYDKDYLGKYYTINDKASTILSALSLKPHVKLCKTDGMCDADCISNVCDDMNGCWGTSRTCLSDNFAWQATKESIVRCTGYEDTPSLTITLSDSVTNSFSVSNSLSISESITVSVTEKIPTTTESLSLTIPTPTQSLTFSDSNTLTQIPTDTETLPSITTSVTWYWKQMITPIPGYIYMAIPKGSQQLNTFKENLESMFGTADCTANNNGDTIMHALEQTNTNGDRQAVGVLVLNCKSDIPTLDDNFCAEPEERFLVQFDVSSPPAELQSRAMELSVVVSDVLMISTLQLSPFSFFESGVRSSRATTVVYSNTTAGDYRQLLLNNINSIKTKGFTITNIRSIRRGSASRAEVTFPPGLTESRDLLETVTGLTVVMYSPPVVEFRSTLKYASPGLLATQLQDKLQQAGYTNTTVVSTTNPIPVKISISVSKSKTILNSEYGLVGIRELIERNTPLVDVSSLSLLQLRCGTVITFQCNIKTQQSTVCSTSVIEQQIQGYIISLKGIIDVVNSCYSSGFHIRIAYRSIPVKVEFEVPGVSVETITTRRTDELRNALAETFTRSLIDVPVVQVDSGGRTGSTRITAIVYLPVGADTRNITSDASESITNSIPLTTVGLTADPLFIKSGIAQPREIASLQLCYNPLFSRNALIASETCPPTLQSPVTLAPIVSLNSPLDGALDSSDDDEFPLWVIIILGFVLVFCCVLLYVAAKKYQSSGEVAYVNDNNGNGEYMGSKQFQPKANFSDGLDSGMVELIPAEEVLPPAGRGVSLDRFPVASLERQPSGLSTATPHQPSQNSPYSQQFLSTLTNGGVRGRGSMVGRY